MPEACTISPSTNRARYVSDKHIRGSGATDIQVRSWGINDNASLGRITSDVPDPNNSGAVIPNEDLETYPYVIEALEKEGFRAVQVAAGDSISVAVDANGDIRAWGSFRVSLSKCSHERLDADA
jgi:alpha-tubulin suppressor-like RCC1 family protein